MGLALAFIGGSGGRGEGTRVAELWAEQIRVFEGVKKDKIFGMDEAVIVGGCFPILLEFFGSSKSFKNVERFCYSGGVSSIFWFRFVGRGRGG